MSEKKTQCSHCSGTGVVITGRSCKEDCCNYHAPEVYGDSCCCMTKPPWLVPCKDPNNCRMFNVKVKEPKYTTIVGPNDDDSSEGWQDESRTETAVEQIYETRYDCPPMPEGVRLGGRV